MATNTAEGHRLLNQLLTLDVSTLITTKPSGEGPPTTQDPSGEKAPAMQVMLQNLADNYSRFTGGPPGGRFDHASATARERRAQRTHPQQGLLDRVARNGQALHEIVERTGEHRADGTITIDEKKLKPADAATIRKAWELALDQVDLSTNVSLVGDVITRFSSIDGSPPPDVAVVFHGRMVGSGLGQWEALMGVVSQFLATLSGFFLR
jgi:hypothetical protein